MRSTPFVAALLVGAVAGLAAQRAHQLELGGYGSFTRYDHLMRLDPRIGAGARVGYSFTNLLQLEVEFGLAQPHQQSLFGFTTVRWGSASLVLNVSAGRRNRPYLLGGYTRIDYGSSATVPYDFADHAVHGAIGDRVFVMDGVAVRFEGRAIFAPKTDGRFGGEWAGHVVGSIGIAMFALSRGPGDVDRDRVSDAQDACPGTPPRATVDRRGCPVDRDGDSVADGIDRCPATPTSAQVDRSGCPIDSSTPRGAPWMRMPMAWRISSIAVFAPLPGVGWTDPGVRRSWTACCRCFPSGVDRPARGALWRRELDLDPGVVHRIGRRGDDAERVS